jgi:hypothetical protein
VTREVVAVLGYAPGVWLTDRPTTTTYDTTPTFAWASDDADGVVVEYEYRLDDESWTTVDDTVVTKTYGAGLAPGNHLFRVRACDNDDNYSPTATAAFEIVTGDADLPIVID